MLRVTLAKILEFSELFRGTAMCIAIAHARMVQYAKHSHCTCQPMGQRLKRSPFTRAYKCALVRSYTLYLYDRTRVPVTYNCVLHTCTSQLKFSVRGAVLCDQTIENCQQQHFTSLSCLHNFHHQHKFCKIIGETPTRPRLVRIGVRAWQLVGHLLGQF